MTNFNQQDKENYTEVISNIDKLDATHAPELKALFLMLNKNAVNNIVFNLEKSKYCDSSGLSAILIGNRLCKDSGGKFILVGLQPNVKKLIEISQLHNVLNIVQSSKNAEDLITNN